jgi:hypothetical protein
MRKSVQYICTSSQDFVLHFLLSFGQVELTRVKLNNNVPNQNYTKQLLFNVGKQNKGSVIVVHAYEFLRVYKMSQINLYRYILGWQLRCDILG